MIVCPRCKKALPDDSDFCQYCGKSITDPNIEESPDAVGLSLKENPRPNHLGKYAILLMILTIIVFDFVLGTAFNAFGWNIKIVYIISMILYILSILLAALSLYVDYSDKKKGYEPSQNTLYAIAAITVSIVVILLNLQQIILK
ncbi:MAG: zinc-ribbon domain-containing protein [Solobacterium sp.]|nr:zinc-ribbon domain-containing protein [Solobacterium sp.]